MKKRKLYSSQPCPLTVQEAIATNEKNYEIPSDQKKKLFHCEGDHIWEEIACRCCEISICGDIQSLMGHGPGQAAVRRPCLSRGRSTRRSLAVLSNFNVSVNYIEIHRMRKMSKSPYSVV